MTALIARPAKLSVIYHVTDHGVEIKVSEAVRKREDSAVAPLNLHLNNNKFPTLLSRVFPAFFYHRAVDCLRQIPICLISAPRWFLKRGTISTFLY